MKSRLNVQTLLRPANVASPFYLRGAPRWITGGLIALHLLCSNLSYASKMGVLEIRVRDQKGREIRDFHLNADSGLLSSRPPYSDKEKILVEIVGPSTNWVAEISGGWGAFSVPPGPYLIRCWTIVHVHDTLTEKTGIPVSMTVPSPRIFAGDNEFGFFHVISSRPSSPTISNTWTLVHQVRYSYLVLNTARAYVRPGETNLVFLCLPTASGKFLMNSYRAAKIGESHPLTDFVRDSAEVIADQGISAAASEALAQALQTVGLGALGASIVADQVVNIIDCSSIPNIRWDEIGYRAAGTAFGSVVVYTFCAAIGPAWKPCVLIGVAANVIMDAVWDAVDRQRVLKQLVPSVADDLSVIMLRERNCLVLINRGDPIQNVRLVLRNADDLNADSPIARSDVVPTIATGEMGVFTNMTNFFPTASIFPRQKFVCSLEFDFLPAAGLQPIERCALDPLKLRRESAADLPVNIALILDTSGSMGEEGKIEQARQAAVALLRVLSTRDAIGIVAFDSYAKTLLPLRTNQHDAALLAVHQIGPGGETCISCGLVEGLSLFTKGTFVQSAAVLMSDGQHNYGPGVDEALLDEYKHRGIPVHTVAFGSDADVDLLGRIAEHTGGRFMIAGRSSLSQSFLQMIAAEKLHSELAVIRDWIRENETREHIVPVGAGTKDMLVSLAWQGSCLELSLISPGGDVISEASADSFSHVKFVEDLEQNLVSALVTEPAPGPWRIVAYGKDVPPAGEGYALSVIASTPIKARTLPLRPFYKNQETAIVGVEVENGREATEVIAALHAGPGRRVSLPVNDRGQYGDSLAGDGTYSASIVIPGSASPGYYPISFVVRQRDLQHTIWATLTVGESDSPGVPSSSGWLRIGTSHRPRQQNEGLFSVFIVAGFITIGVLGVFLLAVVAALVLIVMTKEGEDTESLTSEDSDR